MSDVFFHGDVVFKKINEIPKGFKTSSRNVLAEGELTGHAHTISKELVGNGVEVMENKKGELIIKNTIPIEIHHQQHNSTFTNIITGYHEKLPVGVWKIDYPQEYDHFEEERKRVLD